MDLFELLTLSSEFPTPFTWTYDGRCQVTHGHEHWERNIKAAWTGSGIGMLEDKDRAVWEIAMRAEYGVRIPTIAVAASDGSWNTPWVHPYTHNDSLTELQWAEMSHRTSTATSPQR